MRLRHRSTIKHVDLDQIEAFLMVAEELHFGRAAGRLYLSQPRTSRLVSALEREIGGKLFDRTSRKVELTPLGEGFRDAVTPARAQLKAALRAAQDQASGPAGQLRLGCTITTNGPALTRLLQAFRADRPGCELLLSEVEIPDPYAPLRAGQIDVLVNWLALDEPGLVAGPAIEQRARMVAVGRSHRLAARSAVSVEDIAAEEVIQFPPPFPPELRDAFCPPATPAGRPINRKRATHSVSEALDLVARGEAVHLTVDAVALAARSDIVLVPICDLPPIELGLIWTKAGENEHTRALARTAHRLGGNHTARSRR